MPPLRGGVAVKVTVKVHHTSVSTRDVYRSLRRRGISRSRARDAVVALITARKINGLVDTTFTP